MRVEREKFKWCTLIIVGVLYQSPERFAGVRGGT